MDNAEKQHLEELIGKTDRQFLHWWDNHPEMALIISWIIGWFTLILLPLTFYVMFWYLKFKNQSRWLFWLAFVPFGMWVLLLLRDKDWVEVRDKY
jgi:hypothetical protein